MYFTVHTDDDDDTDCLIFYNISLSFRPPQQSNRQQRLNPNGSALVVVFYTNIRIRGRTQRDLIPTACGCVDCNIYKKK